MWRVRSLCAQLPGRESSLSVGLTLLARMSRTWPHQQQYHQSELSVQRQDELPVCERAQLCRTTRIAS